MALRSRYPSKQKRTLETDNHVRLSTVTLRGFITAIVLLCLLTGTAALTASFAKASIEPDLDNASISDPAGRLPDDLKNDTKSGGNKTIYDGVEMPFDNILPDISGIYVPDIPDDNGDDDITAISTRLWNTSATSGTDRNTNTQPDGKANRFPYLIYVSKNSFTIAILGLDDDGEYTTLLHTFKTAIGRTNAMTRAGTYKIKGRERWHRWDTGGYSPYATEHSGGLWFHGPYFEEKDPYTLRARNYNAIGTKATSGCLRTYTSAAAWIYYNCPNGTTVIIANDSKYESKPIEQVDNTQTYDPTDPYIKHS